MKNVTKILVLLLISALTVCLLANCGKKETDEESGTFSKALIKPPAKEELSHLPVESFNEFTAFEPTGLSLQLDGQVKAGAERVTFRMNNAKGEEFCYGYADILLQKKTADGWMTYRRIGTVPEIGIAIPAKGSSNETLRPEQYGVELQAGNTYRITFENAPDAYIEFKVK